MAASILHFLRDAGKEVFVQSLLLSAAAVVAFLVIRAVG